MSNAARSADSEAQQPESTPDQEASFAGEVQTEERLFRILDEPTSVSYLAVPLPDAIDDLALVHKIPFLFDKQELTKAQLDFTVPVVVALKDMSLRNVLDLMLLPHGMSYLVRNEVVVITSVDAVRTHQYVRVYILPEFFVGKEEKVIEVLTKMVSPALWTRNGGEFSAAAIDGLLTIRANRQVHDACQMVLAKILRRSNERRPR